MRRLPLYLGQTVAIVAEHCGSKEAGRIVAWACERADAQPSRSLPVTRCWPATRDEDVWTQIWRALAVRRPDLFGAGLQALDAEPDGASLAWLYLRAQHPEQLLSGLHDDPERAAVSEELLRARLARLRSLGVDLPDVRTRFWRLCPDCLLHTYLDSGEWTGMSLFCEEALRAHVFLIEPENAPGEHMHERLILHEHLHHATAALACPGETLRLTPLRAALNEATVELLTRCACAVTPEGRGLREQVEALSCGSYQQQVVALLSALPKVRLPDDAPRVLALALANLQAQDDDDIARALNGLADEDRSADEWLAYMEDRRATRRVEWPDGSREWYRDGGLHRDGAPAVEEADGARQWCLDGVLDRVGAPAVEWASGERQWYRHGKLHREAGPAVEGADGERWWYRHGKLHREAGPAIEWADGERWWYCDGELHREDGPAVELADGTVEWWLYGERRSEPVEPPTSAVCA